MDLGIWVLIAALLGVVFGSFLNVVVFRTNTKESFWGRSKCQVCLEPLGAKDLVPIVSYVALKGRCRNCKTVIDWQYPAVEAVTGILFAVFFLQAFFGFNVPDFVTYSEWLALFVRNAIMALFLVIIFVYDFRFYYILDRYSIPAMLLAFGMNVALGADPLYLLLGMFGIGGFFAAQFFVSKGTWIGGGDIRMGMLMGALLGWDLGLMALFLSYLFGAVIGVALLASGKKELGSRVPFGTFLAVGTVVAMLFGEGIIQWYLGFFG